MSNETNTKPTEKDFSLEKVKLITDGGIEAHYEVAETSNGATYVNHYAVENGMEVHPDLKGLFNDLRPIVARTFNMTSFLSFVEDKDNKISAAVQDKARDFANELLECIDVRGVSYSGKNDNVGVVITAIYTTANGLKTCINTPRLKVATLSFGFEEELETIVGNIEREVYKYFFEGKQAEMSLFGADGEPANNSEQEPGDDGM